RCAPTEERGRAHVARRGRAQAVQHGRAHAELHAPYASAQSIRITRRESFIPRADTRVKYIPAGTRRPASSVPSHASSWTPAAASPSKSVLTSWPLAVKMRTDACPLSGIWKRTVVELRNGLGELARLVSAPVSITSLTIPSHSSRM